MRKFILPLIPLFFISCIDNNIPYPIIELYITSIVGDGFVMQEPNNTERTITLSLEEDTDIEQVNITSVSYSPDMEFEKSVDLVGLYNMKMPISVKLSLYQDYNWTISAEQIIERYFTVKNQIGESIFDLTSKTATAYVSESTSLDDIEVTSLKLGPVNITTYDVEIDQLTTFNSYRVVNISYHNTTERWKLYVEQTDIAVSITQSDVRATTASLTAAGETSTATSMGFRYRELEQDTWQSVDSADVSVGSGQFTTKITSLTPDTQYEFVAYLDQDDSEIISATTESLLPLPNGDFEQWSFPSTYNGSTNRSWFPFLEDGQQYWGTGNQGATTLGESYNLTTPTSDIRPGSEGVLAADLQSKNTLKFATGSIFTGTYLKTAGTNGVIGLGRSFTSRPVGLKGWVKYNCGVVNMIGTIPAGVDIVSGVTLDQGSLYIALGTWSPDVYGVSSYESESLGTDDVPLIVDTRDVATFFNKSGPDVVAYGELILTESVEEWSEFYIELDYYSLDIIPTHIIIVCSASRYGDYFTGSSNSNMVLDDLELVWE